MVTSKRGKIMCASLSKRRHKIEWWTSSWIGHDIFKHAHRLVGRGPTTVMSLMPMINPWCHLMVVSSWKFFFCTSAKLFNVIPIHESFLPQKFSARVHVHVHFMCLNSSFLGNRNTSGHSVWDDIWIATSSHHCICVLMDSNHCDSKFCARDDGGWTAASESANRPCSWVQESSGKCRKGV